MTVHSQPRPAPSDTMAIEAWADVAAAHELFWSSTPEWHPAAVRGVVDGETIVWAGDSLMGLPLVAAAVAEHFDGATTLCDLAEDLAYAVEMPLDWARSAIAGAVTSLVVAGALEGVALPDPPLDRDAGSCIAPEQGPGPIESTELDPDTGETIRVTTEVSETGNVVTTELWPDGRRRISSSITIGSDDGDPVAEQVLIGERSPAELVPRDSCLGSKLRNDEDVPLVSFRCRDGRIRSVRCHSPAVADELRRLAGDRVVETDERGPVVAFVVTPLEGSGPLRIYDAAGRRRGRPRTASEAARVVDGLLGAHHVAFEKPSTDSLLPLRLLVLRRGDDVTLVPERALYDRRAQRQWQRHGWTITWSSAGIDHVGLIVPLTGLTESSPLRGLVTIDVGESLRRTELLRLVVLPSTANIAARQALLSRVVTFVSDARTPSLNVETAKKWVMVAR